MLTEAELRNPNISDEKVSEVLYRGKWAEIEILKTNPKFIGYTEEYWPHLASDYELFMTPWYPVAASLIFLSLNVSLEFVDGTVNAVLAVFSLFYIYKIVPLLNRLKEYNRIKFLDSILLGSPFHRDLFKKEESATPENVEKTESDSSDDKPV